MLRISYIHGHDLYYRWNFPINNYKGFMLQILLPKLMFLLIGYSNIKKIAVGSESKFQLNSRLSGLIEVTLEPDCNPLPETLSRSRARMPRGYSDQLPIEG
jgi:hypothetical protein